MRLFPAFFCLGLIATAPGAFAQDLPPGPGREVVLRVCTACHGLGDIVAQRHDADEWGNLVDMMIGNGAQVSDAERPQIVEYLSKTFPKSGAAAIPPPPGP